MSYREIRVRPVVRYIITEYDQDGEGGLGGSCALGEFDNARDANYLAKLLSEASPAQHVFEPARQLRINWLRGPGEPREAIRWELEEVAPAPIEAMPPTP